MDQLKRLIDVLNEPWVNFYIYIDKKSDLSSREIRKIVPQRIKVEKKENIIWGDISMVTVTLRAFQHLVKNNKSGYCILLSGQDYPIQTNLSIRNFLENEKGKNFIDIHALNFTKGNTAERLCSYKINKSSHRGHFLTLYPIFDRKFYSTETLGKLNYLRKQKKWREMSKVWKKRKFPSYLKPFGGSQWFALPVETVQKILLFLESHPDYLLYHKYTLCPDESFFQSIIMYLKKKENIRTAPSLTYVNWERPSGPLPVTFKIEDFGELKAVKKEYFFARKFDTKLDQQILEKVDQELLNRM